ncbi:hypothetical protein SAMN05421752_101402 [Natronorubrum thiooxidans]|uniref:Uncharacterized protein n=1 Tax=Natronorubrum thiooxidans TaxID=308853 RepID=A0A1N7CJY4_9EURY|nr:hypothetical protein SAMN05421752_101402 [Natronorubrum thiooxidans]
MNMSENITHSLTTVRPLFPMKRRFPGEPLGCFEEIAVILLEQYNGAITLTGTFIMIVKIVYQ